MAGQTAARTAAATTATDAATVPACGWTMRPLYGNNTFRYWIADVTTLLANWPRQLPIHVRQHLEHAGPAPGRPFTIDWPRCPRCKGQGPPPCGLACGGIRGCPVCQGESAGCSGCARLSETYSFSIGRAMPPRWWLAAFNSWEGSR